MNKHEFALYYPQLSDHSLTSGTIALTHKELVHRITTILRLQSEETVILFDKNQYAQVQLQVMSRTRIDGIILAVHKNKSAAPAITALIPLLKKDSLETLAYNLVELGVTSYQIISSQKTQRSWQGTKEQIRLDNIMIAAAEQSKNFFIPQSCGQPKALQDALEDIRTSNVPYTKIFFDVDGDRMQELFVRIHNPHHFVVTVGPEGDFTTDEKLLLKQHNFMTCRLTPTVLRSWQAATLGIGVIRSYF
jgi:RsmE family RNA methyltransferase